MAEESCKLSITYFSGLIPPPEIMSTLAVFYDEIWLPQPYDLDIEFCKGFSELYALFSKSLSTVELRKGWSQTQQEFYHLKTKWLLLFEQGLLKFIPPIPPDALEKIEIPSQFIFQDTSYEHISKYLKDKVIYMLQRLIDGDDPDRIVGEFSLNWIGLFIVGWHRVRNDKSSPELFISDPSDTRTSRLAGFLVHSLFQYQVPQLGTLNAEQILEVRDYLKDTKEGFTYYINQMTDDVEQRIKSGNLTEMVAAQKTFERKILPLYAEFKRQLAAKKTGYWANILSTSADFFKVEATPWTPKFYGELLKWVGVALNLTAKDEEALLTNQGQAFQYLATLEKKLS